MDNRVNEKLDKLSDQVVLIRETLAVNTASLQEHMKRSDYLEKRIEQVSIEMKPVKDHVVRMDAGAKIFGYAAALVGIAAGVVKIFEFFNH